MTDNKLEELEQKYKELRQEIDELKAEKERWKPWRAEKRGNYYAAGGNEYFDNYDEFDNRCYNTGDYHQTKEQSKRWDQKQLVTGKLRRLAKGFVPDWSDDKHKWYIYYSYESECWGASCIVTCQTMGVIYFAEEEDAQNAIDTLGDELEVLR